MSDNKDFFGRDLLNPSDLNMYIKRELVLITNHIEEEAAKLNDIIKEDIPISYLYPIRVKILEEKNNLVKLMNLLDVVVAHEKEKKDSSVN